MPSWNEGIPILRQTCKTSVDPGNSVVFDIIRVILEICSDPRRKHFIIYLRLQNLETKKKIDVFRYIFRAKFELKHIISRTLSINKLNLFQIMTFRVVFRNLSNSPQKSLFNHLHVCIRQLYPRAKVKHEKWFPRPELVISVECLVSSIEESH